MNQNLTIFQRVLLHIFWVNFWVSERSRGGELKILIYTKPQVQSSEALLITGLLGAQSTANMPQALRTTGLIPLATDWLKSGTYDSVLAVSNDGKADGGSGEVFLNLREGYA